MHSNRSFLFVSFFTALDLFFATSQNQILTTGWCYTCAGFDDSAISLCNKDCLVAAQRLCANDRSTALKSVQGHCELQYMPPTFPAPYHSASVDAATCTTNFRNLITQCGKETEITGAFDPNYCSQDGGGGTMGWNDDGSVIANSARYVMKTVGLDSCGQHQATWTPSTPEIEWKDSWVPPNSPMTLDTNEQCGVIPPAPVIQTQGCINGVCYVGDPAYYAVCEGQPTKQAVRTMRHRVVFNGWTTTSGQELLSALRLRCHQDVLNWQAWNNGTAWLAEFGIYGDDRGSSCGCIPEAVFDASVGLEVSPASCCESIIVPAPLFQVV